MNKACNDNKIDGYRCAVCLWRLPGNGKTINNNNKKRKPRSGWSWYCPKCEYMNHLEIDNAR